MKVFVTGSTGLLGNNVVRALVKAGHDVVGLTRSAEKADWMLGDTGASFVTGDMRAVGDFVAALDGCDAVVHTAAYFREYFTPGDHAESLNAINVEGTLALMAEADKREVKRFIHVSSAGVIGHKPDGSPGDEDTPPNPEMMENGYVRSKVEGDKKIAAYAPTSGMRIIEILPGWMWGPGDAAPTNAGRLVKQFLAGKLGAVPRGGAPIVDARDVATGIVTALSYEGSGDRFIIGGEFRTTRELGDLLAKYGGRKAPRQVPVGAAVLVAHISEIAAKLSGTAPTVPLQGIRVITSGHRVSSARAQAELGVTFRPLDDTIGTVFKWYAEHGTYETPSQAAA
jgi:dihydroflavonol-4-reductase